jgi:hypothetical protein
MPASRVAQSGVQDSLGNDSARQWPAGAGGLPPDLSRASVGR